MINSKSPLCRSESLIAELIRILVSTPAGARTLRVTATDLEISHQAKKLSHESLGNDITSLPVLS